MRPSLWREHIAPFVFLIALLALTALTGDYFLHRLDLVWIGRYLGILGTLLIIASLTYSLQKRKYIAGGNPKTLLAFHEFLAWLGSLFVLLHAGIHFNAVLPWLATMAMGVNVISGLTGKFLLKRSRAHVQDRREKLQHHGLQPADVENNLFWDVFALDIMTQWRKIHIPIFIVFVVLSIGHILSIFLLWGWT